MGEHSFLLSVQLRTEAHGQPICPTNLVPVLSLYPEFPPARSRRLRIRGPSLCASDREHYISLPKLLSGMSAPTITCMELIACDLSIRTDTCSILNLSS